jgi:hypothetical protein
LAGSASAQASGFHGSRLLDLPTRRIDALAKVAFPAHERHADEGDLQIRRGAQRVAGEHAETAAVSRDLAPQRNLHRKIRNALLRKERSSEVTRHRR